jgi:Lrp/AsnC family leucine-responsive transcriptional regulator
VTTSLDPISRRILQLLVADGRASYQAIADEVGCPPAVMERVKRLEEGGCILGYTARLDRAKTGYPITAFVAGALSASDLDGAEPAVRALAANRACSSAITSPARTAHPQGGSPVARALERILRTLREPGLSASTRTTIVLSSVFEKPGVVPAELD